MQLLGLILMASLLLGANPMDVSQKGSPSAWNLTKNIAEPESVYADQAGSIFIANIAGAGDKKDGKGWIQKADASGKVINPMWVSGLNAPKGMRSHKGLLWVADIDELVGIDLKSAKVLHRHKYPAAKFLNDVAIHSDGTVYVSDTIGSKIYFRSPNGKTGVFAEGDQLKSPNGLLFHKDKLIVAAWGLTTDWSTKEPGFLYEMNLKTKKMTPITKPFGHLDGLEIDKNGDFLVSDWVAGKVYRIKNGQPVVLVQGMKGAADIGLVTKMNRLIVPRMGENIITAFDLN